MDAREVRDGGRSFLRGNRERTHLP
jgi:hypothetical protein